MTKGLIVSLLIAALVVSSTALEWYEQGHTPFLTPANFNEAVMEPNRYKFVKFFTHSCRYCRLLKQVEDELIQQQNWPFRMYDVDCSLNYDLCVAAIQPTGFPFIGIYNMKGELEAKFSGYYPIDVMRDVFRNISNRQTELLRREGLKPPTMEDLNGVQPSIHKEYADKPEKTVASSQEPTQAFQESPAVKPQAKKQEVNEEWSSISEGIKIIMVLFGYWMFDKMIRPYLVKSEERTQMRRQIEIKLDRGLERAKVGSGTGPDEEGSLLLSDTV